MSNERKSFHGIVGMGIRNCRHEFYFIFLLGVNIITLVIIN